MPIKNHPIKSIKSIKSIKPKNSKIKKDEDVVKIKNIEPEKNQFIEEKIEIIEQEVNFSPKEILDSQKEFFKKMAEKIEKDSENPSAEVFSNEKSNLISSGKVPYYKKMILRFSFLVLILLIAVLYFSFSKLNIIVNSEKKIIEDTLSFYAYSDDNPVNLDKAIKASISKIELEVSDNFLSSGENSSGGEIVGKVKIINQYSKNQPLVATTRLLSSDGKLFRIKSTVNVPAGGSVEVDIYTDNSSEEMAIEPSKFTIPGLWTGLQDKIYAESYEKFVLKTDAKKYISQNDIDNAIKVLNEKMLKQAEEKTKNISKGSQKSFFSVDQGSVKLEVSDEVGSEVDSFNVKIKNIINIITFNQDDVVKIAKQKLIVSNFNQDSFEVNPESFNYNLLSFNSARSLAEIQVNFSAKVAGGSGDNVINKKHLVNLSEKQIRAYLDNISELKSYELVFKPGFLKRAPMLVNRIAIEFK